MATQKLFLLPGDGIGPEVMTEAEAIIAWLNSKGITSFEIERGLVGGSAFDAHGEAISEADMGRAKEADAVLFGAVGGYQERCFCRGGLPTSGQLKAECSL